MITGINKVTRRDEREFHLQAEDLGTETSAFEVRVYDKGTVIFQKRFSYAELLEKGLPRTEQDQALRQQMEKTILTVEAAIGKGKIG